MNPWGVLRHFSELNMHIGVVLYCGIFISLMAHPSIHRAFVRQRESQRDSREEGT